MKDDFYLVVLTDSVTEYESIIYLVDMTCGEEFNCTLMSYVALSGFNQGLDQFKVNSFTFLQNAPYFIVSVDNYGLVVIDLVSKKIIEKIPFYNLFEYFFNEFIVYNIIPTGQHSLRILLKEQGSFSLYWKDIGIVGDAESIFIGLEASDIFVNIHGEIATNIVDYSNDGIAQLIYYKTESGLYSAYVRLFNPQIHTNTKTSKEYKIGTVSS